jgi:hypothetical protein
MKKKLPLWIKIPLFLFVLFVGSTFAIYFFPAEILHYTGQAFGWKVSLKEVNVSFHNGLGIQLDDLAVESKADQLRSLQVDELQVLFEPISSKVLSGDFRIEDVVIKHPRLVLVTPEGNEKDENIKEIPSDVPEVFFPWEIGNLEVNNGQIKLIKGDSEKDKLDTGLVIKNISGKASMDIYQAEEQTFKLSELSLAALGGQIKANGSFSLHSDGTSAYTLNFDGKGLKQIAQTIQIKSDKTDDGLNISGHLENKSHPSLAGLRGKITLFVQGEPVNLFGWMISLEKANLLFHDGIDIHLKDLAVKSNVEKIKSFETDELHISLESISSETLQGDFLINEIILKHPHLTLVYPEEKEAPDQPKEEIAQPEKSEEKKDEKEPLSGVFLPKEIQKIMIQNGRITIISGDDEKQAEEFNDLSCTAMLDFSQADAIKLRVSELSLTAFEGKIKATGTLGFRPDGSLSDYSLDFEGEKLQIEKIIRALRLESKIISGEGDVTGQLEDNDSASIEGLSGEVTLSLRDGSVSVFGVIGQIFQIISPTAYLKKTIPGVSASGISFNSLNTTITFENGIGKTDKMLFKSDTWNILAMGSLDFVKEEMDMDYYLQPFQTVNKAISWIPILGQVLGKDERGLLHTSFKVTGKMDDPKIESQQLSNITDKFLGIIKRSLSLPLELIPDSDQSQKND